MKTQLQTPSSYLLQETSFSEQSYSEILIKEWSHRGSTENGLTWIFFFNLIKKPYPTKRSQRAWIRKFLSFQWC